MEMEIAKKQKPKKILIRLPGDDFMNTEKFYEWPEEEQHVHVSDRVVQRSYFQG